MTYQEVLAIVVEIDDSYESTEVEKKELLSLQSLSLYDAQISSLPESIWNQLSL